MKTLTCKICNKGCRSPHLATCYRGVGKDDANLDCLLFSFPQLSQVVELLRIEGTCLAVAKRLDVPYKRVQEFCRLNNIALPSIQQANANAAKHSRFIETCRQKYGVDNVLSRGTPAFHKKNSTVRNRHGVENVMSLQIVKQQITETHLQKYGVKRVVNGKAISETKQQWTDEKRLAVATAISVSKAKTAHQRDSAFSWKSLNVPNKLESKVAQWLSELGIPYEFSFWIAGKQYDFRVGSLLIEVQGDFWHANPKRYAGHDILTFPGRKKVAALSIWEKDRQKKDLAASRGFEILYLWEDEITGMSKEALALRLEEALHSTTIHQPGHTPDARR